MNQQMSLGTFIILALLIGTFGVQLYHSNGELNRERAELARQFEEQTAQVKGAQELRDQFNGIAGAIAKLADEGNPNAIRVRDQLAAQGIAIRAPDAAAAAQPAGSSSDQPAEQPAGQ